MENENMLIVYKKPNIFKRIQIFLRKVFNKNSPEYSENELRKEELHYYNLLLDYDDGYVNENDLTEKDKEKLTNLYTKQISTLEISIQMRKDTLKKCTEKIIHVKSKIENKEIV